MKSTTLKTLAVALGLVCSVASLESETARDARGDEPTAAANENAADAKDVESVDVSPAEGENATVSFLPQLVEIAKADPNPVYAICEICDGVSRTEEITPSTRCHNTYSVAKLFTTTALGVLEDRGLLDTNDLVYPIFERRFKEGFDPKWREVKIRDALRHRIGLGVGGMLDIDAQNCREWASDDFLQILLDAPLKYAPGEEFVYTDAAFYLASRIVSEKTGERLDDFMIRELLNPMGFAEVAFSKCPKGYPMGATGMYISTEDMAKLGRLYVQDGVYDGKRLLSKRFVDKVFDETLDVYPVGDSGDAFGKGGMNGQFLYMNRKTKRVVAIHSFGGNVDALLEFLQKNDR